MRQSSLAYHHIRFVIIVNSLLREIPTQAFHGINESGFHALILLESPDSLSKEI